MYAGDIINGDGTSGESIYGMVYRDENMTVTHDCPYLLSMVKNNAVKHTNNSKFMITSRPLTWLDDD